MLLQRVRRGFDLLIEVREHAPDSDVHVRGLRKYVGVPVETVVGVRHPQDIRSRRSQDRVRRLLHHVDREMRARPARIHARALRDDAVHAVCGHDERRRDAPPVARLKRDGVVGHLHLHRSRTLTPGGRRPRPRRAPTRGRTPRGGSAARTGSAVVRFSEVWSGPSRYSRLMRCTSMSASADSSHGNRVSARALMPPPHGLLRGNAARSTSSVERPAAARVRAATAPAGPAPATMTSAVQ